MKTNNANEQKLNITVGTSRYAKQWDYTPMTFAEFAARCSEPVRTSETMEQFAAMKKWERLEAKDVGGFVAAYMMNGQRRGRNVLEPSMAVLDLDHATDDAPERIRAALKGVQFLIYSTHSSTPEKPRLRLCVALPPRCSVVQATQAAKAVGAAIGEEMVDTSTYDTGRLFFWPSIPKDAPYIFHVQQGEPLPLERYRIAPTATVREITADWERGQRLADPTTKGGAVGAFCRAYTISEAIEKFLPDVYTRSGKDRYTYNGGTTSGGAVVYEDKWLYSHHESDPAHGHSCNAFDLVCKHRFGDTEKSFQQMVELCEQDPAYRAQRIHDAFGEIEVEDSEEEEKEPQTKKEAAALRRLRSSSKLGLEYDKGEQVKATVNNLVKILRGDEEFAGKVYLDSFAAKCVVTEPLPWSLPGEAIPRGWRDCDNDCLLTWCEEKYGVYNKDRMNVAFSTALAATARHPVREYLERCRAGWDGVKRLDTLIIDYLGADDNELNRALTRLQFVAAAARVYRPGVKFDEALVLQGPEGCGKSTLIDVMGGEWYSASLFTVEGKEAIEALAGVWLIELAELAALGKSEVTSIKNFLSKRSDRMRPAYGRTVEEHARQCVFFGTTNEETFLRGNTGNRRFNIIRVRPELKKIAGFVGETLPPMRDQYWSEAATIWTKEQPKLVLPPALLAEARNRQEEANELNDNPLAPLLEVFLDIPLPSGWEFIGHADRRQYFNGFRAGSDNALCRQRERVCTAEFLREYMGLSPTDRGYQAQARAVSALLNRLPDWQLCERRRKHPLYGTVWEWERTGTTEDLSDDDM